MLELLESSILFLLVLQNSCYVLHKSFCHALEISNIICI